MAGLSAAQLRPFEALCERMAVGAGATVFVSGDKATHLYIIAQGGIDLEMALPRRRSKSELGPPITVGSLGSKEAFGWSAIAAPCVYTMSATATAECTLLRMDAVGFRDVLQRDAASGSVVMANLARLLAGRLALTQRRLAQEQYGVIVLPRTRRRTGS